MTGSVPLGLQACLFWSAGAALAYTFVGYGVLMRWLARSRPLSAPPEPAHFPAVTCVVVAFNESTRIAARVQNLLASEYPAAKLRVIVVSDGCTDDTAACVRALNDPRVAVIEFPGRRGKAAGLNAALAQATSPVVVFADARQSFVPTAIARMVRHFADPAVGAVSGSLEIAGAGSGIGQAVDIYWRLEKRLRESEARIDSCIGCTGAIYAIRRETFVPIAEDIILDDVVIPMEIAAQGRRVLFEPHAVAFDPQSLEPARERERKRRTLAGNFQMLFRRPEWLLPWRNRLWWQLISHKYLRLAAPLLLAVFFFTNVSLRGVNPYGWLAVLQCTFYLLAVVGISGGIKNRLFSIPAGFVFLNSSVVRAFWHYLTADNLHQWRGESEKR